MTDEGFMREALVLADECGALLKRFFADRR